MANQKEIRVKIASTKKTMKITSAMKLVAAAKVNKMQKILAQARPYADKVKQIFTNLESSLSEDQKNSIPLLAKKPKLESVLLIVIMIDILLNKLQLFHGDLVALLQSLVIH